MENRFASLGIGPKKHVKIANLARDYLPKEYSGGEGLPAQTLRIAGARGQRGRPLLNGRLEFIPDVTGLRGGVGRLAAGAHLVSRTIPRIQFRILEASRRASCTPNGGAQA